MDRLFPNQQLNVNDQLISNNSLVNLIMQTDGNLVVYRTHFTRPIWASGTFGTPADHTIMQTDGNLVTYAADGTPFWATGTDGNPGAFVVLGDDGNLVVYDSLNQPIWESGTVQDFNSPTIGYADDNGYSYVETSELWKQLCSVLPCFAALQWPGYATTIVEDTIDGQPVIIQLWKGWCQKFLGLQTFPGGIGAEVGVYRRDPGRVRPTSLPFLPAPLESIVLTAIANLSDNDLWWPFPEVNARIEFTLTNSVINQTFFRAGPEVSYWLAKWMNDGSYAKYQRDQAPGNSRDPLFTVDYILDYTINGKTYPSWPVPPPSVGVPEKWVALGRGQFSTNDAADLLEWEIQSNAVGMDVVEFQLEASTPALWRKVLVMPDGQGSRWDIVIDPSQGTFSARNGLWANQVQNGQRLELWKAKTLGFMSQVLSIGNLGALQPGTRVVFRWLQD